MSAGENGARKRLEALEARILRATPPLSSHFWELRSDIKAILSQGALEGRLKGSVRETEPLLKFSKQPNEYGIASIAGGDRHEVWAGDNQFERDDHARFNFAIQVGYPAPRSARKQPELISYHFNLAFPDGHQPTFVRFDLNEAAFVTEGERNAARSPLLSHVHPGHGSMTMPSPILSPQEILDILLHHHLR